MLSRSESQSLGPPRGVPVVQQKLTRDGVGKGSKIITAYYAFPLAFDCIHDEIFTTFLPLSNFLRVAQLCSKPLIWFTSASA